MVSLKKKGLVASVATLAMAIGGLGIGAGTASAAETIKVTGFQEGYEYNVYEIGTFAGCAADGSNTTVAVQSYKGADGTSTAASDDVAAAATKAGVALGANTDKVAALAALNGGESYSSDVRKVASDFVPDGLTAATQITKDGDISVTDSGWYIITAKNTTSGKTAVASLVGTKCGTVAGATGEVELKNPNGNLPGDDTPQNPVKSMVGSLEENNKVQFTLSATAPDYTDMKNVEYAFYDYPAVGLTPVLDKDMTVKVGDTTLTSDQYAIRSGEDLTAADKAMADNSDATNPESKGGKDFVVDLSDYFQVNASTVKGQKVTVVYTATVDTVPSDLDDVNTFDVDNNGVRVPEGPNDPNPNDPGNDTPNPGNGTVQFTKVDQNAAALDGAVFTITADGTSPAITAQATSDENGVVKFANLGAGTYTISENKSSDFTGKAAAGNYMQSASTIEVKVSEVKGAEGAASTVSATVSDSNDKGSTDATNVITNSGAKAVTDVDTTKDAKAVTFEDVQNLTQLPLTGAAGVVLFVVLAALLAGGAGVMVTVSKRNKKNALAL
ncbi:MAG: LPXTG cell wall anchor domain-containing protein [Bifidobacteriaceae bacterium]|nr:LPXTG cell wall anchor domain-containing protein [Bifidobacteriaceae bacterium]MCI1936235.1 LPXTG cell wall anchor domain-containing protein [Bifidobacteriaceae bacterium]